MIADTPVVAPEPSMQHGGVLKPNFSLKKDERNKHDSVSSLDEAVVMAVTAKATPQAFKLNTIKASQSDHIQRSNTLHSSNSVKRSKSQRKTNKSTNRNPSPLASAPQPDMESDTESDTEEDDQGNPFMTEAELTGGLTNTSFFTNNTHNSSVTRTPSSCSANPFLSLDETKAITPTGNIASHSRKGSPPGTPMSETTTVFTSIPIELDDKYDPLSDLAGGGVKLRPWAESGSTAMRDSTLSTMSDGRSSTNGEEIMIFWDGSRDSRGNL
ncbi:hypothetical protein BGZ65_000521 [Modicella reniformis]|uniref:Uncharacterized protein n=1 Tax=Modicella reniformis TaxID=1440133 RepID=A0A9P6MAA0_9FUNG|nr:hypothetical protein BGZ65_000521 [Modicella reniformis]